MTINIGIIMKMSIVKKLVYLEVKISIAKNMKPIAKIIENILPVLSIYNYYFFLLKYTTK